LERGLLPDVALRAGIRGQLRARLKQQRNPAADRARSAFLDELGRGPIATHTDTANDQHYEVPTDFYRLALGPRWKYSSGYWRDDADDLASAEENMLELYVERAPFSTSAAVGVRYRCFWQSASRPARLLRYRTRRPRGSASIKCARPGPSAIWRS
jgi:cyclopropane-fatty-acyl-phospholipid synthase